MFHAGSGISRALAALSLACGLPLAACTTWHTTRPVTIEVVDGLTGDPAPGITVRQRLPTMKFEPPVWVRAISDDNGVVQMRAIGGTHLTYWWVGAGGPAYSARGASQIPKEFREIAASGTTAADRFLAPAWPKMHLMIELSAGYIGPVVEWPIAEDAPRSSGWMAPAAGVLDGDRVAIARVNDDGAVAYPDCFAGVPGFAFVPERGLVRGALQRDGTVVRPVSAWTQHSAQTPAAMGPSEVVLWEFGYAGDGPFVSPEGRSATASEPFVWFVGSESDLRAWVDTNKLQPRRPGLSDELDALGRARVFTRASVMAAVRRPSAATEPPAWTTFERIGASRHAAVSAVTVR